LIKTTALTSKKKEKIEELYWEGKYEELYEIMSKLYDEEPTNPDIVWRFARACFDKHELESDAQAKADFLEKGKNLIESALVLPGGTENAGVYKWRAIFIAEASRSKSPKERIALAFEIKTNAERAMQLDPSDGVPCFILGNWCYEVANISWIQRKVAAAIFATPPTATYDDAIAHFLKCEELTPDFKRNRYGLVQCYEAKADKANAKLWAHRAVEVKVISRADAEIDQKLQHYLN